MIGVRSSDGVVVATHDLGGSGPSVLLAHATGFHGHVFEPLAEQLSEHLRCVALDFRGHGDTTTPTGLDFAWTGFGDDAAAAAAACSSKPVFGFGHSSGGAALLIAAARHRGLFAALYCYEPVLWPDPEAATSRAEKLADGARRRRAGFATAADAYANYASKPPFSWLDQRALRAYVDQGLSPTPEGTVALRCAPEVEAQIYLQGAANDGFSLLGSVTCPVVVARGTERGALDRAVGEAQVAALRHARLEEFEGLSHFGPLEDPTRVGSAVLRAFNP
jgi:pimeloyl-ACP methyl ester carboxylesterase